MFWMRRWHVSDSVNHARTVGIRDASCLTVKMTNVRFCDACCPRLGRLSSDPALPHHILTLQDKVQKDMM